MTGASRKCKLIFVDVIFEYFVVLDDLYENCDDNLVKQVSLPNQEGLCGIISSADFYLYLTSFNKKQSI